MAYSESLKDISCSASEPAQSIDSILPKFQVASVCKMHGGGSGHSLGEEMSRQQILESGVAEKQMRLVELDCGLFIPFSVPRLPLVLFGYAMSLGTTWDLAVGFLVL